MQAVTGTGSVVDADEDYSNYVSARWPALLRSAVLLGCSLHEAEDLVQAALVNCYVSWDKVAKAADRDAYVYRVLVNTHTSNHRRRWWGERPSHRLPEDAAQDANALVDLADLVQRALAGLSVANRQVVILRFFADLTEQQTSDALGIPTGTVKSRLSRAFAQLAEDPHLADLLGRRLT